MMGMPSAMAPNLTLNPTVGVVGGLTIQFAECPASDEIGDGVAMTEEGFDLIEPYLRGASAWTDMHRYGVFELPLSARVSLVCSLRSGAVRVRHDADSQQGESELLDGLANWLEARRDEAEIRVLGI